MPIEASPAAHHGVEGKHCKEDTYKVFPEIKLRGLAPSFPYSYICERFTYFHDRSAYSAGGNM